jgi:ribosomal protein S18 acetylase RimI-like enzyme
LGPGICLREELPEDREFALELYASARAAEMARVPWPDAQKDAFLRMQCQLQSRHYREHHPGAAYRIVVCQGRDIGRIYVDRRAGEINLMEITLLPQWRGRGIGGTLVSELQEEARAAGAAVSLYVESENPARRLYRRMGFRVVGEDGVYLRMEWRAPDSAAAQPEAAGGDGSDAHR